MSVTLTACNPSMTPDVQSATVAGVNIVAIAEPLKMKTVHLTLNPLLMGHAGELALADVLSYSKQKITITAPEGWNLIRDVGGPRMPRQTLYWQVIKTNGPHAHTWTFSKPVNTQGMLLLLTNIATPSAIDGTSANSGGGAHLTAKSVTTTEDGDIILACFASDFGPGGLGPRIPANMSRIVDRTVVNDEYWVDAGVQKSKGKTPDASLYATQLTDWTALQLAIKRPTIGPHQ